MQVNIYAITYAIFFNTFGYLIQMVYTKWITSILNTFGYIGSDLSYPCEPNIISDELSDDQKFFNWKICSISFYFSFAMAKLQTSLLEGVFVIFIDSDFVKLL